MSPRLPVLSLLVFMSAVLPAHSEEPFAVVRQTLTDPKAVFATVESVDVAAARARIGGTVAELSVDEGDEVTSGQVIATVGDPKLALQVGALDAQIAALQAQQVKAQEDLRRAQELFNNHTIARARLDEVRAAADVADNQLKARQADRSVIRQQMAEGQVLAPAPGRVLQVPVTVGSVIMPGETVATIAADSYILRLRLPERHARFLKSGDGIRLADADIASDTATGTEGRIIKAYPQIDNGRVVADAEVPGLAGYFVGQRVRVWVMTDQREGIVVPAHNIMTRSGVDYARVKQADGSTLDVPVQRGQPRALPDMPDGIEILSGLRDGDTLVVPEK